MESREELKSTTVRLPPSLLKKIKIASAEDPNLNQGKIMVTALKKFFDLRTSLSWKESREAALEELVFKAQISDDPEDTLEFPITVETLISLHKSCHEALKKAGVSAVE